MPRSSQRKNKHEQEMLPTSQKLDVIDRWLQKMLDVFPQKQRIETHEIEHWHQVLTPFSVDAIEFSFGKHQDLALFFPLYGQILDLCIAFSPPDVVKSSTEKCDAICRARHGKGYGEEDIKYLMHRIVGDKPFYFKNGNPRMVKELLQAQVLAGENSGKLIVFHAATADVRDIESLLAELDGARGGAPQWRAPSGE